MRNTRHLRPIAALLACALSLLALSPAAVADGTLLQQSSTGQNIILGPIISATDHITNLTGATLTVTISKNGGSFAAPAGAVTEISKGRYQIAANATDNNTLGPLSIDVVSSLANPATALVNGSTLTTATTGGSIAANTYNVTYTYTTAAGETTAPATASVTTTGAASTVTVTAPALPVGATGINVYAGTSTTYYRQASSTTNTATWSTAYTTATAQAPGSNTAVAGDPWGKDYQIVAFNPLSATNLGLSALPTTAAGAAGGLPTATNSSGQVVASSVVGSVGSVTGSVGSVSGAVGSVTGNVGGNVVGSVGSVTGGVTVTTNNDKTGYTASTVSDKTGYSLAASQNFNNTNTTIPGYWASTTAPGYYTAPPTVAQIRTEIDTNSTQLAALVARTDPTTALTAVKAVTDKLNTALELSGSNYRFTALALANTPAGSAPSASAIADAVWQYALFPSFSTLRGLQDTWATSAGPSTATYPTSTTQTTHYFAPDGATGQHSTGLTTNSSGKPTSRTYTSP